MGRKTISTLVIWTFFIASVNIQYSNNASINDQKAETQGLYGPEDDVEILTDANFKQTIYGNKRALLVEFYNAWCGFCQRFAPSWKAFASDVKAWNSVVGIAAIDCANKDNYPLCRDFEIMAYPTLKYFHENYQEAPENLGLKITTGKDFSEHRLHLIETIVNEQNQGRAQQFPLLSPFEAPKNEHDLFKIFEDTNSNVKHTFLVIQDPSSHIGQELMLDFHILSDIIIKYTHTSDFYSELLRKYNINSLPGVLVLSKSGVMDILVAPSAPSRNDLRISIETFLKTVGIHIPEVLTYKKDTANANSKNSSNDASHDLNGKDSEKVKDLGDAVYQMDLETTIRYSLKYETSRKQISGEKLTALKNYIDLLSKYFPFGKNGKTLLHDIGDLLNDSSSIMGSEVSRMIKVAEKVERQVFSTPPEWLACKGSSDTYRGYPCGLWKLFHFLTVNAALDQQRESNPRIVLETMHGYIKNFFGCADCSQHFQEMAQKREMDKVSSFDESILWLWAAHNEVNNRLHGDATEDPEFPKIQFPSKKNCPQCYDANDNWNMPDVLQYLKDMYKSINVRHIGSDTKILYLGLEGSTGGSISSFRKLDECMYIGLCVFSFLLIIMLIKFVMRRGYRKKMYVYDLLGKV